MGSPGCKNVNQCHLFSYIFGGDCFDLCENADACICDGTPFIIVQDSSMTIGEDRVEYRFKNESFAFLVYSHFKTTKRAKLPSQHMLCLTKQRNKQYEHILCILPGFTIGWSVVLRLVPKPHWLFSVFDSTISRHFFSGQLARIFPTKLKK